MKGKIIRWALLSLLFCVITGLLVWVLGQVSGQEFSPQRFAVRRFRYYKIPFTQIQLTPVTFSPSVDRDISGISAYLRKNRLLGKVSRQVRWDIMQMGGLGFDSNLGDADILVKYLEQPGAAGTESWLEWSKDKSRREVVEQFWPVVARLAEAKLYILLPDVFDWARKVSSASEFSARLREDLPKQIEKLAAAERARTNKGRAEQLVKLAAELSRTDWAASQASERSAATVSAEADPEELAD